MNLLGAITGYAGCGMYADESVTGVKIASFAVSSATAVVSAITGSGDYTRITGITFNQGDMITLDGSMTAFTVVGSIVGYNA